MRLPLSFEEDVARAGWLMEKIGGDVEYARLFYSAQCNVLWYRAREPWVTHASTWRSAAAFTASLRKAGETYIDFYCGEGNPGSVDAEVRADMLRLGWEPDTSLKCYEREEIVKRANDSGWLCVGAREPSAGGGT